MPPVGAAVAAIASAAVTAAPAIGAAAGVYSVVEAEKARKSAEKQARRGYELRERQAGEYYRLTQRQMELQTQESNIRTLASLIESKKQPSMPRVFTLPAAKTMSPVQQINTAIDKLLRG